MMNIAIIQIIKPHQGEKLKMRSLVSELKNINQMRDKASILGVALAYTLSVLVGSAGVFMTDQVNAYDPPFLFKSSTVSVPNLVNQPLDIKFVGRVSKNNAIRNDLTLKFRLYADDNLPTPIRDMPDFETKFFMVDLTTSDQAFMMPITPTKASKYTAMVDIKKADGTDVTRINLAGRFDIVNQLPIVTPDTITTLRRINSGATSGVNWQKDNSYTGGGLTSRSDPAVDTAKFPNTVVEEVYHTAHYGDFTYKIDRLTILKNYTIRLHFNEYYYTSADQRVFDVEIDGKKVLTNFDIYKAAGGKNIAITKDFAIKAPMNGEVNVKFTTVKGNSLVSGIELIGPSTAPSNVKNIFHTEGTKIIDPNGKEFIPLGANVGAMDKNATLGTAAGHSDAAKAWGWNTIRLLLEPTDERSWLYLGKYGRAAYYNQVDQIVQEYTNKGIVVILDAQINYYKTTNNQYLDSQLDLFWKDMAAKYKNNSYVWFNVMNEPAHPNNGWIRVNEQFTKIIRNEGATNIIMVTAQTWGQDLGTYDSASQSFTYSPRYAPYLAKTYGNIVLDQHNYGSRGAYTTPEKYTAYIDKVHAAGIPLITGEAGFSYDGSFTAAGYLENVNGATSAVAAGTAKGVGILWWSGTEGDKYNLKTNNGCFYCNGAVNQNLTPAGKMLWNRIHPEAPIQ